MAHVEPKLQCICCTDPGTLTCSGCRDAKYCSRECQEADHQFHKHLCKTFARFQPQHRPSPEMRRVVHFPAYGDKPEFMWLPVKAELDKIQLVDYSTISDDEGHRWVGTGENRLNGAPLDGIVSVSYDDHWVGKLPPNQAIITATNGKASSYPWGGTMICIRGDRRYTDEEDYELTCISRVEDMDMRAYSFLIIHMINYNNFTSRHSMRLGQKVEAVKILSKRDRDPGTPWVQAVEVPRMHPLFEETNVPAFTRVTVQFPLLTMRIKDKSLDHSAVISDEAAALHLAIDPNNLALVGSFPGMATGGSGDVYLANTDRSPLAPDTAEAFVCFCQQVLAPIWDQAVNPADGGNPGTLGEEGEKALQQIMPENWLVFFLEWQTKSRSTAI